MFRIFFLFLILCGCQKSHIDYIDPETKPYIDRWTSLIGVYPVGVSISLVDDLPDSIAGHCDQSFRKSFITLNRAYWNGSGDYSREFMIFHELGHCFFSFEHDESKFRDLCPASIMYPMDIGSTYCYGVHRGDLMKLYKLQSGL